MTRAKLPVADPKALGSLAWVILAAAKEGSTKGLRVELVQGSRRAVATDTERLHVAWTPEIAPLPTATYEPPTWDGPDWVQIANWELDWTTLGDVEWESVRTGRAGRVDGLYGYCRAAIAYGQSIGWEVPTIFLHGYGFPARALADAIAGGWDDINGADLVIQAEGRNHLIRVTHVLGGAMVSGVSSDQTDADAKGGREHFDATNQVTWEGESGIGVGQAIDALAAIPAVDRVTYQHTDGQTEELYNRTRPESGAAVVELPPGVGVAGAHPVDEVPFDGTDEPPEEEFDQAVTGEPKWESLPETGPPVAVDIEPPVKRRGTVKQ
jgi:hypothetical protein